jgi:hypothetical protein
VTIKATSALSILAIWVSTVIAVLVEHGSWWIIIFAFLATGAVGVSAWRRLGVSRLLAIVGTWAGLALAAGADSGAAWASIFAFLTTGAVVYSTMRRDAIVVGLGIAAAWLAVGIAVAARGDGPAWMCIFAFLTAGAIANSGGSLARGGSAILWWGITLAVVLIGGGGWAWLSVLAFLLTSASIGFSDFHLPTSLEWDLFDRDDDAGTVR